LKGRLLRPLSWQVERTLRARESLRSSALVGLERLRRSLLALARALVEDGVLPSADALFQLDVDEVNRVDAGFRPDPAFWEERRAEIEALASQSVPAVLHRLDDLEAQPSPPNRSRLEGVGLSGGRARGRAWVVTDPVLELPEGFDPSSTILVTRTVDLGWLVVFSRVAGAVVEMGGHLSYGSIVLGELGLPSVTNVGHVTRLLRTGDLLEVRADEGVVERLGSEGS
jgi:pyruvate,water dikinase